MSRDIVLSGSVLDQPLHRSGRAIVHRWRVVPIRVALGALVGLIYVLARPPLYERDGFMYQLLGRDFLGGTNPHHLMWNGLQALITRVSALVGVDSVLPFQLVGMAFGTASALLLYNLLLRLTGRQAFVFAAALFVALAPWTWFMAFQNQPYAPMFVIFVVFLSCFATDDDRMPRGVRFGVAALSAVGMVALQQAAILIVVSAGVCFLAVSGWRRAVAWAAATGLPTAALYVVLGVMNGVTNISGFWHWVTGYLRSQHSIQARIPDSLAQSVMGIISAFVNQEALKELMLEKWSTSMILWCYGIFGLCLCVIIATLAVRRPAAAPGHAPPRPIVWISVGSIASWAVFCVLWEPTNYYWFILLAPFFVLIAATFHLSEKAARVLTVILCIVTAWNVYANHLLDVAGTQRAPEPQLHVIAHNLRPNDVLWVVDLGWSGDIDYDLLSSAAAFEHLGTIRALSDIVGASRDVPAWQRAIADSNRKTINAGGRVFLSDRVFDPDAFDLSWEQSPFSDYRVERPFPINWPKLARELPAFVERNYEMLPSGFFIGSDTIWRLESHPASR